MADLSQFGLMDVPNSDHLTENDSDLEEELLRLMGNTRTTKTKTESPNAKIPLESLNNVVSDCLKDSQSDDSDADNDDLDESEFLNELSNITGNDRIDNIENSSRITNAKVDEDVVKLLEERLKIYKEAAQQAVDANDTARARRFQRAIVSLEDSKKMAKNGQKIDESSIPPEIKLKTKPDTQTNVEDESKQILEVLTTRQNEFKRAAVQCKRMNDIEKAKEFAKIAKKFDIAIEAVQNGQKIDLSEIPDSPVVVSESTVVAVTTDSRKEDNSIEQNSAPEESDIDVEKTVDEALEKRLEIYKKQEEKAKASNDSSKARRFGRICKQFEQAIKAHQNRKPFNFDELPTPPGLVPIQQIVNNNQNTGTSSGQGETVTKALDGRISSKKASAKQLEYLIQKQKTFKIAAVKAKQNGDLNQARELLRTAKRFDSLIEACEGGLPIDMKSIPNSPELKSSVIKSDTKIVEIGRECDEKSADIMDILNRAEKQLSKQLEMCLNTRDHYQSIGDLNGVNKFEKLSLSVTKDLDLIRVEKTNCAATLPKLRYENKEFSLVKCHPDIADQELELTIVRGVNYNCTNPRDIDTYVKFEFPYPKESPVRNETDLVKNTNNPEYNTTYTFPISRNSRSCLRIFKRASIKFEVYSRGWFFLSDKLLGTVSVKLQPLESHCEVHECFEIFDGRKPTGGKLEVKLRLRNPLLTKEFEQISEKWLSIDNN